MLPEKKGIYTNLFDYSAAQGIYSDMGAHKRGASVVFRVFAPDADRVLLVGSFNAWKENNAMLRISDDGIFEAILPQSEVGDGAEYKYLIFSGNERIYKTDPYAIDIGEAPFYNSVYREEPATRIALRNPDDRFCKSSADSPMNIYEISCDSSLFEYARCFSDMARELGPYLCQMGYTHVCLTDISEKYPDSYSYVESTAYYCARVKYGGIEELCSFVEIMHSFGIKVLLEWRLRGKEISSKDKGIGFFVSNGSYWISLTAADGLSVAADDQTDFASVSLIMSELKAAFPDTVFFARDGALGGIDTFDAVMNLHSDCIIPDCRENAVGVMSLPKSLSGCAENRLFDDGFEDVWQKRASARVFAAYMMLSCKKKLTVAGEEMGIIEKEMLRPDMKYADGELQLLYSDLGELCHSNRDHWGESGARAPDEISVGINEDHIIAFSMNIQGCTAFAVFNFSAQAYENAEVTVFGDSEWAEVLNTDSKRYGGSGVTNEKGTECRADRSCGKARTVIRLRIPPLGVTVLIQK